MKNEAGKLTIQDKNSNVPSPIISKMYYDRAVFTFEISNDKVCLQYFFGPRFGRCIEFDIIEDENIHFGNERTLWVS